MRRSRPSPLRALITAVIATIAGGSSLGSARPNKPPRGPQPGDKVAHQGKIDIVRSIDGGAPQLTDDKAGRWLLVGSLRDELLRLGGHKVKVHGLVGEPKVLMRTIDVQRYEILDAGGGKRPEVGVLRTGPGDVLQLHRGRDEVQKVLDVQAARPLAKRLRQRLGCKVWLLGEIEGNAIKAYKFGWLSCRSPKPIRPQKETRRR